jgi:hypothetical protein
VDIRPRFLVGGEPNWEWSPIFCSLTSLSVLLAPESHADSSGKSVSTTPAGGSSEAADQVCIRSYVSGRIRRQLAVGTRQLAAGTASDDG